ncbi:hypothetical protein [Cohnella thermotolerans]|uniref:hypothetical protein n=1 Tax=Cohnella thermotolerans TaxID=329858 RepID=UPI00047A19E7|nr:hypothetical protein [Cohnella thermotolerans]
MIENENDSMEMAEACKQLFVAVPVNDVVMQICEGVMKLKNAKVNPYNACELICQLQEENQIALDMQKLGVDLEVEAMERIRLSQVQLLLYLLYTWRNARSTGFMLDLKDFYEIRRISRRSENQKRLLEDLELLQSIGISIKGKNKKQTYYASGALLQYKQAGRGVQITMGDWIQHLSPKTFTWLHKQFFSYHSKHEWVAAMLSLKFAQLSGLDNHKVKIGTLLKFLGMTDSQIKKQGCQYYQQLLNNAFYLLSKEGYRFPVTPIIQNDLVKFSEAVIVFQNVYMLNSNHQVGSESVEPLSNTKVS